jgi:hypothetical protein
MTTRRTQTERRVAAKVLAELMGPQRPDPFGALSPKGCRMRGGACARIGSCRPSARRGLENERPRFKALLVSDEIVAAFGRIDRLERRGSFANAS